MVLKPRINKNQNLCDLKTTVVLKPSTDIRPTNYDTLANRVQGQSDS